MQTKILKYSRYAFLLFGLCVAVAGTFLNSCEKSNDQGDNGITILRSFGPMPIARGAELRFIGQNLDKITEIDLPGNIVIPSLEFGMRTSELVTITVPQNAVEGLITLKCPTGDITTKTPIGFSEPISIAGFTPTTIKADSVLTITGDYLNLVKEIIFTDRITVSDTSTRYFISKSRHEFVLRVPPQAQTGKIAVSNGEDDPIIVYSTTTLAVKVPVIATIVPNPVKAGSDLTITGSNLDLVKSAVFGGDKTVTTFKTQTNTQLILTTPETAKDGKITLIPASGVKIMSANVVQMMVPTVTVTPTTVKNGADITVTGTNLDLIDQVIFGGNQKGTIKAGGTGTEIMVTVPDNAITDTVKFVTKAAKTVKGPVLTMVDPVFTSFTPATAKANTDIVISGTDLDLVVDVIFTGNMKGTIGARTATSLTVTVPIGAKDGKITLVAKNGVNVASPTDITVPANLPEITSFVETRGEPGKILTLIGTKLLLIKTMIFPGNIVATDYGMKSDTKVEVYVPKNVTTGNGNIRIITYEGEQGLSPQIYFGATDPVQNPALVFFDFDAGDCGIGWNGIGAAEEDAALKISGKYYRVNATVDGGWVTYFARNWGKFSTTGVDASTYAVRMDINVLEPVGPAVVLKFRLKSSDNDFWYAWKLGELFTSKTTGWITVSLPLSQFKDDNGNGKAITNADLPKLGAEYGLNAGWGGGKINMCIDNVRFEKLP